jgi:hypothetical protein
MLTVQHRGPWIDIFILSLASTLLYHTGIAAEVGVALLAFLVPLQVLCIRRGLPALLASLALVLASVIVVRLLLGSAGQPADVWKPFLVLELFSLVVLMGGLVLVNAPLRLGRVYRLLAATAAAGLLSVPLILHLRASEPFTAAVRERMGELVEALTASGLSAVALGFAGPGASLNADSLLAAFHTVFLRCYLFDYFLMLTGSWWVGSRLAARLSARWPAPANWRPPQPPAIRRLPAAGPWRPGQPPVSRLAEFHLPDAAIWPLIAGLALVLLDIFLGAGTAGVVGWNTALVFLFLFGLAGIGILQHLFRAYQVPRNIRVLFVIVLLVLVLSPRVSFVALLLIPGLGISETWIKYRKLRRSENQQ